MVSKLKSTEGRYGDSGSSVYKPEYTARYGVPDYYSSEWLINQSSDLLIL
jgi:hypothetical protein